MKSKSKRAVVIVKMDSKLIRVDERTWEIIRREAIRQTFKKNCVVSMGGVIDKMAEKLNKKHRYVQGVQK